MGVSVLTLLLGVYAYADYLLIPMDENQNNHLKAYGLTYTALSAGHSCKWILNYRGGSFLLPNLPTIKDLGATWGVSILPFSEAAYVNLRLTIDQNNMDEVELHKPPRIAVYTPPNIDPWADSVTLVLHYAEIPYDKIYDNAILSGKIAAYDWLHLHHEDFSGQYSKFWRSYSQTGWFREKKAMAEKKAREAGFASVREHKGAVAKILKQAVSSGLFLFAMCAATETLDIALACQDTDVVDPVTDGTPVDPLWKSKINYTYCLAFEKFEIYPNPLIGSFSDIDYNQVNTLSRKEAKDFVLFEFSAKLDPIPTLLNQNHRNRINGFFGLTTSFQLNRIKDGIVILAETINKTAKYIYGTYGEGHFTFYAGHSPEDKTHQVGDSSPDMELNKNSPGYRLILNNILFPSVKTEKKKT